MKLKFIIILSIFLIGCAASEKTIGSNAWLKVRTQEIEDSFKNKEISKSEYLSLKNQTEQINLQYRTGGSVKSNHVQTHWNADGTYGGITY